MIHLLEYNEYKVPGHHMEYLDWRNQKFIYRSVTEGKLFDNFYPGVMANKGPEVLYNPPSNPNYVISADYKDEETGKYCSCWTMNPEYTGAAFNESYLRLVFDTTKMSDLSGRIFYGGGKINEAEIRIESDIKDWTRYLHGIETTRDFYENGYEWEEFEFAPLKIWLPKELSSYIVFKPSEHFEQTDGVKTNIYNDLYRRYGSYKKIGLL
jgi:hypothetical protein